MKIKLLKFDKKHIFPAYVEYLLRDLEMFLLEIFDINKNTI